MKLKTKNQHRKLSTILCRLTPHSITLCVLLAASSVHAGSMKGTAHDLASRGFGAGENCIICHTPHDSDISVTVTPLWNHQLPASTFKMYFTEDENIKTQPTGASKLCLSCHDGVTAIDKFGGRATIPYMNDTTGGNIKNRQSDSHPISIIFDSEMAAKNPSLYDPTIKKVTIGTGSNNTRTGTISELLLPNGRIQCSSCHDVHNNLVGANEKDQPFLKITKAGSEICLTCHNK